MKSLVGALLGFVLLTVPFESSRAKEDSEWHKLNAEAEKSFYAGKYAEAIDKTKASFALAEKTYGLQSAEAATSLAMMGHLLLTLGQHEKAEALYRQAMEIREKVLGKNHGDYGASLGDLAGVYRVTGRYIESEPLTIQALAIQEKMYGPEHDDVLANTSNLGLTYGYLGQYDKAIPYFQRVIAAKEKKLGDRDPQVSLVLLNLAEMYRQQGKFSLAEPIYLRTIKILESNFGADHPNVAMFNNNLALMYFDMGQYVSARRIYLKSLDLFEKTLGDKHPLVATTMSNLANVYMRMGQYDQAEKLLLRTKSMRENIFGAEHVEVAASLSNLGVLYAEQSRNADAEAMHFKALPLLEKKYGPDHPEVAKCLNNLAQAYTYQGRYDQAKPLHLRSLTIREKALGQEHPEVGNAYSNLGDMLVRSGKNEEAEPALKRAIAIWEKTVGQDYVDIAIASSQLALIYVDQSRFVEAEALYLRALSITEKAQGVSHPRIAGLTKGLGDVYSLQKQYAKSESMYKRSLDLWQAALGNDHYLSAIGLGSLAVQYLKQDRTAEALETARRASAILRKRYVSAGSDVAQGNLLEQKSNVNLFNTHLEALSSMQDKSASSTSFAAESFEVAQLARASSVGQSLSQMAARFAQRGDALALMVRAQQDARDKLDRTQKMLLDSLSLSTEKRSVENEQKLRKEIVSLNVGLETQAAAITASFPKYQSMISQEPVNAQEALKLLGPEEAMLVYSTTETETYAWLLTRQGIVFHKFAINADEIGKQVQFLRGKLVPNASGQLAAMTPATSARLSQSIFAPLEPSLVGIKHILLVADGALQSLPFGVLSSSQGGQQEWLAKRYAFSVLPSVSALRALRTFSQSETGKLPFAGFGDPVLTGDAGGTRNLNMANVFKTRSLDIGGNASTSNGLADVDVLRKAPPLPETGDELRALSSVLNGSADALFLKQKATETLVKQSNLSDYRFLAFATHGVMAGELSGVMEPGLVLTPPTSGSAQDDGYLSASEVAQLKLNADWVLLSACNTAAPDGTPGAEGLSGLAKAFFYAGSRSLLVSNWPVASAATQVLVTDTVSTYAKTPSMGKAEAIKQAMGRMMENPEYAHPFYWGAFIVVGE